MKATCLKRLFIFISALLLGSVHSSAQDVDIHGFISQGYLKTNQNNYLANSDDGSFQFNEMGINFTTFVSKDLKVGCQFFARDLGELGNDEIVVNWALAEYTYRNWLGLRAGIVKLPFGLYNDTRDFDSLRTWIFLPPSVYDEWLRDNINKIKGIELFGSLSLSSLGMLKYQATYGISPTTTESGTAKFITEVGPNRLTSLSEIEIEKGFCVRLIWNTPVDGLRFGGSYMSSDMNYAGTASGADVSINLTNTHVAIFSAEYVYRNLKVVAENFWNIVDIHTEVSINGNPIDPIDFTNDVKGAYYASIGYQFTDWFEASYYYSTSVGPDKSLGPLNELKDNCISLKFNINYNWIAKLETHIMDGKYGVSPDNDGHTYNEWLLFSAKISYSF